MKNTTMIVAAIDANGEPDLFFLRIKCTEQQIDNGEHYDAAREAAENAGYEAKWVCDQDDKAGKLMSQIIPRPMPLKDISAWQP